MKRIALATLSLSLLASLASNLLAAEKVTRKSDTKALNGDVTKVTKDEVTVKELSKETKVPSNDIVSIEWTGEPPGMLFGRGPEKAGKYAVALVEYDKAIKDTKTTTKPNIVAELEFLVARCTAKAALGGDATKLEDAISKLDKFTKVRGENYHFYEAVFLLGELHASKKDFAAADLVYQKLNSAPWPDYKMAAKNASARAALVNNDLPGALAKYEDVANMKGESAGEAFRRNEAMAGKAAVLVAQNKLDDAMKVIDSIIEASNTEEASVMAEAYVLQGDCLQAQNKIKEAILAYLHVPLLFEKEKAAHARALYNLAILWAKVDQPERAEQAKRELQEGHPENEWTKKLQ